MGKYFITMCVLDRKISLGKIENKRVILNNVGKVVEECWQDLPKYYPFIELDEFVVMPDHIHGIIFIKETGFEEIKRNCMLIPKVVKGFKTCVFYKINKKIWQKSYFDKIIRNEKALKQIRGYIRSNPVNFKNFLQD